MLNKLLLLTAAILMQGRVGDVSPSLPPQPGTPGPANGPIQIFVWPGNIQVPFIPDQLVQQQPQQPLPPGTATVDGIVTILGTTDPVPGAVVEMRKTECGRTG